MYQIFNAESGHWHGWAATDETTADVFAVEHDGLSEAAALTGILWANPQTKVVEIIPFQTEPGMIWDGNKWVDAEGSAKLSAAKLARIAELNSLAQLFINRVAEADKVPPFELASWPLQAAEAKLWAVDKYAETPMLDKIAISRAMSVDKLKAAALRKALAYEQLAAHVAGQRQALQSKIERAMDIAELDAIEIVFTEPEAI